MNSRRAFTLIELLSVMAIVVLLAGTLMPVMAHARERARQASCMSNEQQLLDAMMMYAQDYDDVFPRSQFFPWDQGCTKWYDAIQPYVQSQQVLVCLSVPVPVHPAPGRPQQRGYAVTAPALYWEVNQRGLGLSEIEDPAGGLILVETGLGCAFLGDWHAKCYWTRVENESTQYSFARSSHNGGMNTGYADGHVKWRTVSSTKDRVIGRDDWRVPFGMPPYYPW